MELIILSHIFRKNYNPVTSRNTNFTLPWEYRTHNLLTELRTKYMAIIYLHVYIY